MFRVLGTIRNIGFVSTGGYQKHDERKEQKILNVFHIYFAILVQLDNNHLIIKVNILMFILPYLKPYWKVLIAVLLLGTINQVFSLLDPQVFRRLTDNYITKIEVLKSTPDILFR